MTNFFFGVSLKGVKYPFQLREITSSQKELLAMTAREIATGLKCKFGNDGKRGCTTISCQDFYYLQNMLKFATP